MKKVICYLIVLLGSTAPIIVTAASYSCTGNVDTIALAPNGGMLQVNTGHGVHYLCKLQVEHNGVHPDVCKAWYAMFLSAQASGRKITQLYDPDAGIAQNCAELGSWVTPNPFPYYVYITNQ